MLTRLSPFRIALTIAALAAILAVPIVVVASHQFSDVPDSNPYHNDIDALADSGVTSGCGGGNFCPSALVTREQMAAFMNRLGALAPGKTPVVNATKLDGLDSTQFARSDVPVTGHFNCMGIGMQPWISGVAYAVNVAKVGLYLTAGTEGYFNCPVILPDGATIVGLRAGVFDNDPDGELVCYLLAVSPDFVAGGYSPAYSNYSGATPGNVVLVDTTITTPTVDNDAYAYLAECGFDHASPNLVLRGVSIEYSVSGLPVP
jgi:hypothetical protein